MPEHNDVWRGCGRFWEGDRVGEGVFIIVFTISLAEVNKSNNYLAVGAAEVRTYFYEE